MVHWRVCLGNRWTKWSVQLKKLNGEFAFSLLIDYCNFLAFPWDDPNSFLPHGANQGNGCASQNRERDRSLLPRNSSPERLATWN
jgi:hypothetical protein